MSWRQKFARSHLAAYVFIHLPQKKNWPIPSWQATREREFCQQNYPKSLLHWTLYFTLYSSNFFITVFLAVPTEIFFIHSHFFLSFVFLLYLFLSIPLPARWLKKYCVLTDNAQLERPGLLNVDFKRKIRHFQKIDGWLVVLFVHTCFRRLALQCLDASLFII